METIPLDFQWSLLERKVGNNSVTKIKKELDRSRFPIEIEAIGTEDNRVNLLRSGWYNGKRYHSIQIYNSDGSLKNENEFEVPDMSLADTSLGNAIFLGAVTFGMGFKDYLKNKKPEIQQRIKMTRDFERTKADLLKAIIEDAKKLAESVELYSESLEKVSTRIGKNIMPIDTGKPQSYLIENGEMLLRTRAGLLGANAIVDFSEKKYTVFHDVSHWYYGGGNVHTSNEKCSIGIPVKIR
ncbi:MAG TPA: hypothetical protein HA283_05350 [Nanoarchaeota archaeon]|nr:hypothetical protein [Nanoarchaeota archaeon]HIH63694.1 hypothetical protein [Nanoarchaeota archaeon]HIJ09198.1 hypothetical protein [Nanoarchaeota archaeon]